MGCQISTQNSGRTRPKRPRKLGELAVFFPSLRLPRPVDFTILLPRAAPNFLIQRLADLRARISAMAAHQASSAMKPTSRIAKSQGGGLWQGDLLRALEEYLPVLLGLVRDGNEMVDAVEFSWVNQVDDTQETTMANAWYEVLSVLHLMAMLCLSHANQLLLLPPAMAHAFRQRIIEENRRIAVDVFLKAAGYLDFAVRQVLPRLMNLRGNIPTDLDEGMLRALCHQALGQGVSIQLEMAIDSPKATLAVKRRFACEMVVYWKEALGSLKRIPSTDGWVAKHGLYFKWKCAEAKAAAYFYHGHILKEGSETKTLGMATAALRTADWFLRDSRRACEAFNSAFPKSRTPIPSTSMKSLAEKIAKDAPLSRFPQKRPETAPPLPDFVPALAPDEYQLPPLDAAWEEDRRQR